MSEARAGSGDPARGEFANAAKRFANRATSWPAFPTMEACTLIACGAAVIGGPFGTGAMPAGSRSLFWLILMAINYTKWRLWIAWLVRKPSDWPLTAIAGGVLLSLPLPLEIELAYWLVLGERIDVPAAGVLLQNALLGLLILGAVFWWTHRSRLSARQDRTSEDRQPGPLGLAGIDLASISALIAEDHYCRVVTAGGADRLVLCRFGDAIAELDGRPGGLARRGAWIADSAIVRTYRAGRSWALELACGRTVAVSASQRRTARQRGWLTRR